MRKKIQVVILVSIYGVIDVHLFDLMFMYFDPIRLLLLGMWEMLLGDESIGNLMLSSQFSVVTRLVLAQSFARIYHKVKNSKIVL